MSGTDPHLGTGDYDPRTYWSARARASGGGVYDAVCGFGQSSLENRCMDRVHRRCMAAALRRVPHTGGPVLEYGCGAGRWVEFFQGCGYDWHGVDISEDMLELARQRHSDVKCRRVEDDRIPYPDASFAIVYSVTVLHHNPHPRQAALVREMVRVLRPGGHLLLYEAVGREGAFNMFPRPLPEWLHLMHDAGVRALWQRGTAHWVVRKLAVRLRRRLAGTGRRQGGTPPEAGARELRIPLWRRIIAPVDFALDPYLQPLLPARLHTSALMLAVKDFPLP